MNLVARNIKYMLIFTGVPWEGRQLSNDSDARPVTINFKMYLLIYGQYHVNCSHAYWPLFSVVDSALFLWSKGRCYVSLNGKMKTVIF